MQKDFSFAFLVFSSCNKDTLICRTDICPGIPFRLKVIPSWMEKKVFFYANATTGYQSKRVCVGWIALSPSSGHVLLHMVFLASFHCDVTIAQPFDGPFDCDVIMQKSANRCDVGPLAKGQLGRKPSIASLNKECSTILSNRSLRTELSIDKNHLQKTGVLL